MNDMISCLKDSFMLVDINISTFQDTPVQENLALLATESTVNLEEIFPFGIPIVFVVVCVVVMLMNKDQFLSWISYLFSKVKEFSRNSYEIFRKPHFAYLLKGLQSLNLKELIFLTLISVSFIFNILNYNNVQEVRNRAESAYDNAEATSNKEQNYRNQIDEFESGIDELESDIRDLKLRIADIEFQKSRWY
jgi:hypothetical protein